MTDLESLIILNALPGVGPKSIMRINETGDSPVKLLENPTEKIFSRFGISEKIGQTIKTWKMHFNLKEEMRLIEKHNVTLLAITDNDYPENLRQIHNPPPLLYVKGELLEKDENSVAIVGSRRASLYGLNSTRKIAYQLASMSITVVSGMARGIDSMAHKGALEVRGRSIAVLGSGLAVIYPTENKNLYDELAENGAVISEFPMKSAPIAKNFPRRNRIISGLTLGVVVIEAAQKSGSLITAHFSMEFGRTVFALPGRIDSQLSRGVHELLKDGACLVTGIEDIINELPELKKLWEGEKCEFTENKKECNLTDTEKTLFESIDNEPRFLDEIIDNTEITVGSALQALLTLEMKKMIKQLPGKKYVRNIF